MSYCKHREFLKVCEIINENKQTVEFICESCLIIFQSCSLDQEVPKTLEHTNVCGTCNKKRRTKAKVSTETWQDKLIELRAKTPSEHKKKKLARA